MTNELSPKSASALLRRSFATKGVKITHTEALDLLARLKGYETWSHMSASGKTSPGTKTAKKAVTEKTVSLVELLMHHYGPWGDCPAYPRDDWKYQVDNGDTPAGYFDWLVSEIACHEDYVLESTYVLPSGTSVTSPDGTRTKWTIEQNLTDRWGDLNPHKAPYKPGLAILQLDEPLLKGLQEQMTDELTFVVRKDNEFGLLFEVEYASKESESSHSPSEAERYAPHCEVKARLLQGLQHLALAYPKVAFCVPDEYNIVNDRPAVWAFFKAGDLTAAQRRALSDALSNLS